MSLPAGGVLRTRRRAPPPGRGAWGALRRAVASHPNRSYWLGSALYSAFAFACYRVASLLPASHEAVGTSAVLALTHFLSVALLCRLAYALAVRGADWPAGRLARALVTVLAAAAMVVLYCASKLFYNWLAHATGIADPWAPLD